MGGQRYIDGHGALFELWAGDLNIVGAAGWPRALFAEHVGTVLEESTVVAVPP